MLFEVAQNDDTIAWVFSEKWNFNEKYDAILHLPFYIYILTIKLSSDQYFGTHWCAVGLVTVIQEKIIVMKKFQNDIEIFRKLAIVDVWNT